MLDDLFARFAELGGLFQILEIIGLVFLLLIGSETLWDIFSGYRRSLKETGANIAITVVSALLERSAYGLVFVVMLILSEAMAITHLPMTWWSWIAALVVADLTYYWMHRIEHRVRVLWTYHSVHHSSPEFNLTTALRLAWIEGLIEWVFFVPMILIGFDAVQTIAALAIVVAYQTWIHTEKVGSLGWADKVFNTPSNHRVHHAKNPRYIDTNYGGILILWDRLFGTYQQESDPPVYGITEPVNSSNPLVINFRDTLRLVTDLARSGSAKIALKLLFMPPGWAPRKDASDAGATKRQRTRKHP